MQVNNNLDDINGQGSGWESKTNGTSFAVAQPKTKLKRENRWGRYDMEDVHRRPQCDKVPA